MLQYVTLQSETLTKTSRRSLSELERQILEVLWLRELASADQVGVALAPKRALKDSTIRTILRRLGEKGYVRFKIEGQTYVYSAVEKPGSWRRDRGPNTLPKDAVGLRRETVAARRIPRAMKPTNTFSTVCERTGPSDSCAELGDGNRQTAVAALVSLKHSEEIGFPHGRDQWISVSATNWAVMALASAVEQATRASR